MVYREGDRWCIKEKRESLIGYDFILIYVRLLINIMKFIYFLYYIIFILEMFF